MRLSKTFLNWRYFTLKYQLSIEDLDSLLSMTIDEDLENMIEQIHQICFSLPPEDLSLSSINSQLKT
jgi:hypothetical protein